jgi:hypothetical protein
MQRDNTHSFLLLRLDPDIKTYNIVLSAPQYDYYPAYPTAKMIDFGLCFDDKRYDVPSLKLAGVGTRGWGPPVSSIEQEKDRSYFPVP